MLAKKRTTGEFGTEDIAEHQHNKMTSVNKLLLANDSQIELDFSLQINDLEGGCEHDFHQNFRGRFSLTLD